MFKELHSTWPLCQFKANTVQPSQDAAVFQKKYLETVPPVPPAVARVCPKSAVEPGGEEHGGSGQEVPRADHLHAGDQGDGGGGGEEGAGHRLVPPGVPATTKWARGPGVEDVENSPEHPGDVPGLLC